MSMLKFTFLITVTQTLLWLSCLAIKYDDVETSRNDDKKILCTGSFESPWFCEHGVNYLGQLCDLKYDLKWNYDKIFNMLSLEFTTIDKQVERTPNVRYVAGLLYPHLNNLWFHQPNMHLLTADFAQTANQSFFWNDFEPEQTRFVALSKNHYQLRQPIPYESLTCARVGLLIFQATSSTKWNLIFRMSSYEIGGADCQLGKLVEPIAEIFLPLNHLVRNQKRSFGDFFNFPEFENLKNRVRIPIQMLRSKTVEGLEWVKTKINDMDVGIPRELKAPLADVKSFTANSSSNLIKLIAEKTNNFGGVNDLSLNYTKKIIDQLEKSSGDLFKDKFIIKSMQNVAANEPKLYKIINKRSVEAAESAAAILKPKSVLKSFFPNLSKHSSTGHLHADLSLTQIISARNDTETANETSTTTTESTTLPQQETDVVKIDPSTTSEQVVDVVELVTTTETTTTTTDESTTITHVETTSSTSQPLVDDLQNDETTTVRSEIVVETTVSTTTTTEPVQVEESDQVVVKPTEIDETSTTTSEPTTTTTEEMTTIEVETTLETTQTTTTVEPSTESSTTTTAETTSTTTETTTTTTEEITTTTEEVTTTTTESTTTEEITTTTTTTPTTTTEEETTTTTTTPTTTTTTVEPVVASEMNDPSETLTSFYNMSDEKLLENIKFEVTNYTVVNTTTGDKSYSLRLHIKGYKWNDHFTNVNSTESQLFMRNKILPLLYKFLNVTKDELNDVKLIKLSKGKVVS